MDDAIAWTQGNAAASHDEGGQGVLRINVYRLGVGRGMAEGMHGEVGRKTQTGQIFQLIPGHGAGGILRADGGHLRLAVGAGSNALYTTGFTDHLLSQGVAFTGIFGLLGLTEYIAFAQAQRFAGLDRKSTRLNSSHVA